MCDDLGMSVRVRDLTTADWPRLWPFLEAMGTFTTELEAQALFNRLLSDRCWMLLGAVIPDVGLVGYAAAQDYGPHLRSGDVHRTVRLHDMFVAEELRRRGTGRALMDEVVCWAGERARYLEWQAHETRAAPFYEKLGYRGEPCPQPDYPTFEITFDRSAAL